jgi:hypothetical protein
VPWDGASRTQAALGCESPSLSALAIRCSLVPPTIPGPRMFVLASLASRRYTRRTSAPSRRRPLPKASGPCRLKVGPRRFFSGSLRAKTRPPRWSALCGDRAERVFDLSARRSIPRLTYSTRSSGRSGLVRKAASLNPAGAGLGNNWKAQRPARAAVLLQQGQARPFHASRRSVN